MAAAFVTVENTREAPISSRWWRFLMTTGKAWHIFTRNVIRGSSNCITFHACTAEVVKQTLIDHARESQSLPSRRLLRSHHELDIQILNSIDVSGEIKAPENWQFERQKTKRDRVEGGASWLAFSSLRSLAMGNGKTSFASFLINIQHPTSLSPQTLRRVIRKKRDERAKSTWKKLFNYFSASIYVCKMLCRRERAAPRF